MPPERRAAQLIETPAAYVAQIERLRRVYARVRRLDSLAYGDFTLADLGLRQEQLARQLALRVSSGAYAFGPVRMRAALIGGKQRMLGRSNLLDTIVLGVLARALAELVEPSLSTRVYSYRPGRSSWEAVSDLRRYLVEHRTRLPARERGLYVLHRDVTGYGDSIPVDEGSALWSELSSALERASIAPDHVVARLARTAFTPTLELDAGLPGPRPGVPTGSPVQTVACNLYLSAVDRLAESVPGAFYARYGDDMLFCHPDAGVAQDMATHMDATVERLRLRMKPEKRRTHYLTGPGRASPLWPESRATSRLDYLGFRLSLSGDVSLKAEKSRRLLRELGLRARCAAAAAPGDAVDEARTRIVCSAVARALDPGSPLGDPAAAVLRYVVSDRAHLRELDYAIALSVAEALSGKRGPRAFRWAPYRMLREHGLPSLVAARNAHDPGRRVP